jgi:hypothetical protein
MKKLLGLLVIIAAFIAYTLTDGSSYSGMLIGVLLLPLFVVAQLILAKLFLPKTSKSKTLE